MQFAWLETEFRSFLKEANLKALHDCIKAINGESEILFALAFMQLTLNIRDELDKMQFRFSILPFKTTYAIRRNSRNFLHGLERVRRIGSFNPENSLSPCNFFMN